MNGRDLNQRPRGAASEVPRHTAWPFAWTSAAASYSTALVVGILFVVLTLSLPVALGIGVDDTFFAGGDRAQHVIGQRYFIADAWRWPLLTTRLLAGPQGVNISLTDSIPLAAIVTKLFRSVLPQGFTSVMTWLALCYVLQPVAATFALRASGEKRVLSAVVISILSLCVPTLLYRIGHTALCSHFLIFLAIGLYFKTINGKSLHFVALLSLLIASLLVHPYIMTMVAAVAAAAPITLLLHRDPRWLQATLVLVGAVVVTGAVALVLGYGGQSPGDGYGVASMNLISPFYPWLSSLYEGIVGSRAPAIDATGAQYEGYQYLGAGLIFLAVICLVTVGRHGLRRSITDHPGAWIISVGLALFSISNKMYFGHISVANLGRVPDFFNQFRSSGRFFWPVTYFFLIGAVCGMMRIRPAFALLAVAAVALGLQVADTRDLRGGVINLGAPHPPLSPEAVTLRRVLPSYTKLRIWPREPCGEGTDAPEFIEALLAASDTALPINTMYVARQENGRRCDPPARLEPGQLLLFMPLHVNAAWAVTNPPQECRMIGKMAACSLGLAPLSGFPPVPELPAMPTGRRIAMTTTEPHPAAVLGWMPPEAKGTWTEGAAAFLAGYLDSNLSGPQVLTLWAHGEPSEPVKNVTVAVDGTIVARWQVQKDVDQPYQAVIPEGLLKQGPHVIGLDIAHPVRPSEVIKGSRDERAFGIFVRAFSLDPKTSD